MVKKLYRLQEGMNPFACILPDGNGQQGDKKSSYEKVLHLCLKARVECSRIVLLHET